MDECPQEGEAGDHHVEVDRILFESLKEPIGYRDRDEPGDIRGDPLPGGVHPPSGRLQAL